jgi:hypothetical protein
MFYMTIFTAEILIPAPASKCRRERHSLKGHHAQSCGLCPLHSALLLVSVNWYAQWSPFHTRVTNPLVPLCVLAWPVIPCR